MEHVMRFIWNFFMLMTALDFVAKLQQCTKTTTGWRARCPAHEDKNPSLSISDTAEKILIVCHAGCSADSVCKSVGVSLKDLFHNHSKSHAPVEVASYDYRDEAGTLLYQVVRYSPKTFKQRRPDGNGGWIWNLKGVRLVPFRLPELIEAVRRDWPIYIHEGEKDVLAFCEASFCMAATCNSGGAGPNKWHPEFNAFFKGASVTIVADKDEAGYSHAFRIRESIRSVVRSVCIKECPNVSDHAVKDFSDLISAGGGIADLEDAPAIVESRRVTHEKQDELPQSPSILPDPFSWDHLLQSVDYSDNLLGNRLLERGQGILLYGPAGCGKSVAALQAACEWAAGLDGFHIAVPRPLRILILQTEDSENDTRENLNGILDSHLFTSDLKALMMSNLVIIPPVPGGSPRDLAILMRAAIEAHKPDIINVNPLLAFCTGDPSKELGGLLYQVIDPIIKQTRVGFLGVHHTTKTNTRDTSGYGAHDWQYLAAGDARVANWPRAMIQIEPMSSSGAVYRFRASKRGMRTGWTWDQKPTTERYFKHAENGVVRWADAMPEEVKVAANSESSRKILSLLPSPMDDGVIREIVIERGRQAIPPISKGKVESWLKIGTDMGFVERYETKNKANRLEARFRAA